MHVTATDKADLAEVLVSYLQDLISISSVYPPGRTTKMARYIEQRFADWGYTTEIHSNSEGLENVVARIGSGSPSLVFNVHVDTVAAGDLSLWTRPPFQGTVEGGDVFGLGAANCKGSAAVQLWLAEKIVQQGGPASGEIVFTFVTDEESLGPDGMFFLRHAGVVKPDMLLLGAPTDNSIITTERGVLWVEITTTGRPAHAGQPQDGDNAIMRMLRVIRHLDSELQERLSQRIDGDLHSTFSLGMLNGGNNTNVVPSKCVAQLDRRLLPSEDVEQAYAEIRAIIESAAEPGETVAIEKIRGTNGFSGKRDGALVTALAGSIAAITGTPAKYLTAIGVSDGRYFSDDGVEIVNFGPGIGSAGHAPNESVSIQSLKSSALILYELVRNLTGFSQR